MKQGLLDYDRVFFLFSEQWEVTKKFILGGPSVVNHLPGSTMEDALATLVDLLGLAGKTQ